VLQDAAVIGRRGPLGGLIHLVRSAHPDNEIDAVSAVHRLVDEDLLELEDDTWSFRSDVVRDVAYQTLTKLDRARSHLGIATFLEHIHDQTTPTPTWLVDQLAFHYDAAATLAGDLGSVATSTPLPSDTVARARRWVLAAAQRSERDGTMATAVRRYRHAVELATEDGASDEELADLEIRLAEAAVENWDAETALAAVTAAETLVPDARSRVHAASAVVRGQVEQRRGAIDAAVDHLAIAAHRFERLGDLPAAANAKRLRALAEIFGGRLDAGRRSAQAAFDGFEDLGDVLGQAWALQHLAWIAFVRGDAAEADGHLNGAIERFSDVGDTRGLAWSLGLAAWVRFQTRRVQEASILAHLVLEEARARRDSWAIAMMTMLEAATALWSGRTDEAVALAQESERGFRALGNQYGLDQSRAIVGRSLVMAGRVDEGFRVLDEEPPIELPADELAEWLARPLTRLATAAQVGEVERAGGEPALVDAAQRWAGVTSPVLGLLLLQGGRVDEAEAPLDLPAADVLAADDLADRLAGTDPSLTSVQALWFSVAHRDGAVALADAVADSAEATYLDRTLADLAAAARRAALGDADGADRHLLRALRAVAGTEDRVAPAIVALANAAVATALRRPDAEDLTARADQALGEMGLRAEGWRRLFAAAAATGT
jgi:tetratricopeptide (TPR) repeat protein